MLTWWGIMLDVVDTPYRGGVLCLRGGALCSASVWRIHHIKHNTPPPPLYGVSTTVVRIGSLACFFFVSSATKRSVWPSVMIPLYSRVKEAKVSKCKQSEMNRLTLRLFVPCFPAFFDLLISLDQ